MAHRGGFIHRALPRKAAARHVGTLRWAKRLKRLYSRAIREAGCFVRTSNSDGSPLEVGSYLQLHGLSLQLHRMGVRTDVVVHGRECRGLSGDRR